MNLKEQKHTIQTIEKITIGEFEISKKNIVAQELINTLYTKKEVELLNKWISPHEIKLLNDLFHKGYIIKERTNKYNRAHREIQWVSKQIKLSRQRTSRWDYIC